MAQKVELKLRRDRSLRETVEDKHRASNSKQLDDPTVSAFSFDGCSSGLLASDHNVV